MALVPITDFPSIKKGEIYLDWSCMSLRPKQVISAMLRYYEQFPACSGRSNHRLAKKVEDECEKARTDIVSFFDAKDYELIMTKNTTEGLNLIANALEFGTSDRVIISDREHNSNLVPWLHKKLNVDIAYLKNHQWDMKLYDELLLKKPKLVSIVGTSNLTGQTLPIVEITKKAHAKNVLVCVDGSQMSISQPVSLKKLDVDFYAFSGHKMLGPHCGGLFVRKSILKQLNGFIVGGDTVSKTTYTSYTFLEGHEKFEGGLQDYAALIGLGEAVRYLKKMGMDKLVKHKTELNSYITKELESLVTIIGPASAAERGGVFNFIPKKGDVHEIALLLDQLHGVMVRSGQHCVNSYFEANKLKISIRASFGPTTTMDDAKAFVTAVKDVLSYQ